MPNNKNAYIRHRFIDSLLRNNDYVKTSFIIEKLYERHDISVGATTINKDLRDMELELHAPIEYCNKRKAYFYPEDIDEIFPAIELQDEELNALLFYTKTLLHYKNIGIFKDFTNAIDKVFDAVKIETSQRKTSHKIVIQPENFYKFKGSDLIPEIIAGFDSGFKFNFDYLKHTSEKSKNHTVTPILLKEFDHLWYLVAKIQGKEYITIFALDRINNFKITTSLKEDVQNFDPEDYFNHVFGISVPDGKIEDVVLEFDSWRGKYLLTSPIHKSQKLIEEKNGKMRFNLKIIPFHELHSKILSYGNAVKVISPDSLKLKIKCILQDTLNQY